MGDESYTFEQPGIDYRPEELSSYILRKLVQDAETHLGTEIKDVVITCPAYFGPKAREATALAGEIAGLNVREILNEPTAAAIAYGMHQDDDQVILVYDLGGGTFDITMIEIKGGSIQVIVTGGNDRLGGRNWDEIIANYAAEQWMEETGSSDDPMANPETNEDLFAKAETAKLALSAREKTEIAVVHQTQRKSVTLTREKFDELTSNLLENTISYTNKTLEDAKTKNCPYFDQILLVGGSTKMPQVAERLQREFGIEPKSFDPDEAVAKGAALFGQKLAVDEKIKILIESWGISDPEAASPEVKERAQVEVANTLDMRLPDVTKLNNMAVGNVTSRSFGVDVIDAAGNFRVSNLIKVNDRVPTEETKRYGTNEANQQTADIVIKQNLSMEDSVDPTICEQIGYAPLPLPPNLPANSPIDVTFKLSADGRLYVMGLDLTGNNIIEAEIITENAISKEEIEEAKMRSTQITVS
jgi:molecular chaperone DnaK (HSP70)